jgi:hypothetical protein
VAAGEALTKRKLLDLKELRDEAKAAIEKKSLDLGLSAAVWSFVLLAAVSAYGMTMAACYIWLAEALAPQMALLIAALISIGLALAAAAVWKRRKS